MKKIEQLKDKLPNRDDYKDKEIGAKALKGAVALGGIVFTAVGAVAVKGGKGIGKALINVIKH